MYFGPFLLFLSFVAFAQLPPEKGIPLLATPQKSAEQQARAKRLDLSSSSLKLNEIPRTAGTYTIQTSVNRTLLPELPVTESDTIVVGEIVQSDIFATQSQRGLYTDYSLALEQVLKSSSPITGQKLISIIRPGGKVRLEGNLIVDHEIRGYGPEPVKSGRYLMFLEYVPGGSNTYVIVKFWKINGDNSVTAAFEQDERRVKEGHSAVEGKSISEIVALVGTMIR